MWPLLVTSTTLLCSYLFLSSLLLLLLPLPFPSLLPLSPLLLIYHRHPSLLLPVSPFSLSIPPPAFLSLFFTFLHSFTSTKHEMWLTFTSTIFLLAFFPTLTLRLKSAFIPSLSSYRFLDSLFICISIFLIFLLPFSFYFIYLPSPLKFFIFLRLE